MVRKGRRRKERMSSIECREGRKAFMIGEEKTAVIIVYIFV